MEGGCAVGADGDRNLLGFDGRLEIGGNGIGTLQAVPVRARIKRDGHRCDAFGTVVSDAGDGAHLGGAVGGFGDPDGDVVSDGDRTERGEGNGECECEEFFHDGFWFED